MQAESMLSRTLFVVAVSLASTATSAADFYLDEFTVTRGGATVFQDTFSDGVAPPNAPDFSFGVPGAYAVFGSFAPGSEAGGKLRLDTLAGSPSCNAPCEPDLFLRARLLTNADPCNLAVGLKSGFTFTASALYDFSATPGPIPPSSTPPAITSIPSPRLPSPPGCSATSGSSCASRVPARISWSLRSWGMWEMWR